VVNIAAKIRSVAGADQILISPSLEEKIQGSDIPVLKLEDKIVAFDGERLELFEVLWREMT
jgi:class 3 adenylate cyclase